MRPSYRKMPIATNDQHHHIKCGLLLILLFCAGSLLAEEHVRTKEDSRTKEHQQASASILAGSQVKNANLSAKVRLAALSDLARLQKKEQALLLWELIHAAEDMLLKDDLKWLLLQLPSSKLKSIESKLKQEVERKKTTEENLAFYLSVLMQMNVDVYQAYTSPRYRKAYFKTIRWIEQPDVLKTLYEIAAHELKELKELKGLKGLKEAQSTPKVKKMALLALINKYADISELKQEHHKHARLLNQLMVSYIDQTELLVAYMSLPDAYWRTIYQIDRVGLSSFIEILLVKMREIPLKSRLTNGYRLRLDWLMKIAQVVDKPAASSIRDNLKSLQIRIILVKFIPDHRVFERHLISISVGENVAFMIQNQDIRPHKFTLKPQMDSKFPISPQMPETHHSSVLKPGDSEILLFKAPDKPMRFVYFCSMLSPRHRMSGLLELTRPEE